MCVGGGGAGEGHYREVREEESGVGEECRREGGLRGGVAEDDRKEKEQGSGSFCSVFERVRTRLQWRRGTALTRDTLQAECGCRERVMSWVSGRVGGGRGGDVIISAPVAALSSSVAVQEGGGGGRPETG